MPFATTTPLASVVVVNFNGRRLLSRCLDSLRRQSYVNREIIVVDNKSVDGSVEFLAQDYPEVRVVPLNSNRGFAGGCNAGVAVARGDVIATLNNDAEADPDWLAELVRVAVERPDVGMVAAKMLVTDSPTTIDSTGICLDRAGIAWDRFGGQPDPEIDEDVEVFGPSAGAALYRRALFDDVGFFDEDFFLYLEDVDLAWRARIAGWRCVHAPRARVFHDRSATAVDDSAFKRFHLGRNKVWLIAKNYPTPYLWLYLPIIVMFDVVAVAVGTLGGGPGHFSPSARFARLAGRAVGIATIRTALAKRASIQSRRRVPNWRVFGELSVLPGPKSLYDRYGLMFQRRTTDAARFDNGIVIH